jgi:hypothetical protein
MARLLFLQLETLGLSFPSPCPSQSNIKPHATGGGLANQSSVSPTERQPPSSDSRPLPMPLSLSPSTSRSSSKLPKRGSAFEDEGSLREKAKFVEWMKTEGALLGVDNQSSDMVTKPVTLYPQRLILTSR